MESSIYTSNNSNSFNITNDLIVIDTSDNRIGVNTIDPSYSIDVRDLSDVSGIIYTEYLKTGAIISNLTPNIDVCYNLGSQDNKWNEIHTNYLDVSRINFKNQSNENRYFIGLSNDHLVIKDISNDFSVLEADNNTQQVTIPGLARTSDVYSKDYIDNSLNLKANTSDIPTDFYSQSYIDSSLNLKANASDIPTDFYSTSDIDTSFNNVYTKSYIDNSFNSIVIPTDFYSQSYVDSSLNLKANASDIPSDFYSQSYIDSSLNLKANTSDIPNDFYSQSYVDSSLNLKANTSDIPTDFYSQSYIDSSLNLKANASDIPTDFYSQSYIDTSFNNVTQRLDTIDTSVNSIVIPTDFYSQSYVDSSLNLKANTSDIPTDFYSQSYVDNSLTLKANASDIPADFYSKNYIDSSLNLKTNTSDIPTDFYSQSYVDSSLNLKANTSDIPTDFYSQSYVDSSLNLKANTSDIPTDFYSQSYIDNSLNLKANASDIPTDFYSQSYIDNSLNLKANINDIPTDFYSTSQIDASFNHVSSRLDTIDTSVNSIVIPTDFYSTIHIDASFNSVESRLYNYVTQVDISNIIGGAPEALNTLKELADALSNDASFSTTVVNRFTNIDISVSKLDISLSSLNEKVDILDTSINSIVIPTDFYSQSYVDSSLNLKANTSDIPTDFYSQSYVDNSLNLKANASDIPTDFYSQSYVDNSLNLKANTSDIPTDFYSQSYIDNSLNLKANTSDIPNNSYSQSYIDNSLNLKANINDIPTDFYSTSDIDTSFNNVYTKSYIDNSFNNLSSIGNVSGISLTNTSNQYNYNNPPSGTTSTQTYNVDPSTGLPITTGGTGLTVYFTVTINNSINSSSLVIIDGGQGYSVGDQVRILQYGTTAQNGSQAYANITSVQQGTFHTQTYIDNSLNLKADKSSPTFTGKVVVDTTGQDSTNKYGLIVGNDEGNVALNVNDGDGNASVTFNHHWRVPDSTDTTQSAGRITCEVDARDARMNIQLGRATTQGSAVTLSNMISILKNNGNTRIVFHEKVEAYGNLIVGGNLTTTGTITGADTTITGDLSVNGNITVVGPVNGIDINNNIATKYYVQPRLIADTTDNTLVNATLHNGLGSTLSIAQLATKTYVTNSSGAIGPQGPAGADGADGADGVDWNSIPITQLGLTTPPGKALCYDPSTTTVNYRDTGCIIMNIQQRSGTSNVLNRPSEANNPGPFTDFDCILGANTNASLFSPAVVSGTTQAVNTVTCIQAGLYELTYNVPHYNASSNKNNGVRLSLEVAFQLNGSSLAISRTQSYIRNFNEIWRGNCAVAVMMYLDANTQVTCGWRRLDNNDSNLCYAMDGQFCIRRH